MQGTIIPNDKMDHVIVASSVFLCKSKKLNRLIKLSLSGTGILEDSYGDDLSYAHFSLDLFAHGSNYTNNSFAKLLHNLELPLKSTLNHELFLESIFDPFVYCNFVGSRLWRVATFVVCRN